LCRQPCS